MKQEHESEQAAALRAVALLVQALEAMGRVLEIPDSPIEAFLPAVLRRRFRRAAARLRAGKSNPRYPNLHTADELADILERTALRDEILEQALADLERIMPELKRYYDEHPADPKTVARLLAYARERAKEDGPGSPAAIGYRELAQSYSRRRRRRVHAIPPLVSDPVEERKRRSAAEILHAPPSPEEIVVSIPPEDGAPGRERLLIRIGVDGASWVGNFACGPENVSKVVLLPDDRHLFVSAGGAGYILDAESRTLVQDLGTEFVGVLSDEEPMTLFVVHHRDGSLEAFGSTGRLWRTPPISAGGAFRHMTITEDALAGETRPAPGEGWVGEGWVGFRVDLGTGEVFFGEGGGGTEDREEGSISSASEGLSI